MYAITIYKTRITTKVVKIRRVASRVISIAVKIFPHIEKKAGNKTFKDFLPPSPPPSPPSPPPSPPSPPPPRLYCKACCDFHPCQQPSEPGCKGLCKPHFYAERCLYWFYKTLERDWPKEDRKHAVGEGFRLEIFPSLHYFLTLAIMARQLHTRWFYENDADVDHQGWVEGLQADRTEILEKLFFGWDLALKGEQLIGMFVRETLRAATLQLAADPWNGFDPASFSSASPEEQWLETAHDGSEVRRLIEDKLWPVEVVEKDEPGAYYEERRQPLTEVDRPDALLEHLTGAGTSLAGGGDVRVGLDGGIRKRRNRG